MRKKCAISSGPRSGGTTKMIAAPNASDSKTNTVAGWIRIRVQQWESALCEPSGDNAAVEVGERGPEPGPRYSWSRRIRLAANGAIISRPWNEEERKSFQAPPNPVRRRDERRLRQEVWAR